MASQARPKQRLRERACTTPVERMARAWRKSRGDRYEPMTIAPTRKANAFTTMATMPDRVEGGAAPRRP